jgi:NADH-quinone oxidoreductase subunit I
MYGEGLLRGLVVTLRNFIRRPVTISYPEQRVPQHSRFRGQEFTWYQERCTGCASCAKYCPLGIIRIVTDPHGGNEQDGGSYKVEAFDIDQGRCMYCALCVEACPYDALHMGTRFEAAQYRREDLVINVEVLKAREKHPSTWYRPQLERQGDYSPYAEGSQEWDGVGREPYFWHPKRPEMGPSAGDLRTTAHGDEATGRAKGGATGEREEQA